MTDVSDARQGREWVFYDGACHLCTGLARQFTRKLGARGISLAPFQAPWVRAQLGLQPGEPLAEMKVLTRQGHSIGGADAVVYLARRIWWAFPLWILAHLPFGLPLLRRGYRWVADNRHCLNGACALPQSNAQRNILSDKRAAQWPGWLPLLLLPSFVATLRHGLEPWAFMWMLAVGIFAGCKWLTWWCHRDIPATRMRHLGYLLAWPGMDAKTFLDPTVHPARPSVREWFWAVVKAIVGAIVLWVVARRIPPSLPLLRGWAGLLSLVFLLHFGSFHIVALSWQAAGVSAQPIMQKPALATSLSDFWGSRWNLGFHQLAGAFVFRPLQNHAGTTAATLAAFLTSGLVHDLVISFPAGRGYGLPTAYFMLQAAGLLVERSKLGKRCGMGRGLRGWLFTLLVAGGPAFWLFHPWFLVRVVLPFLGAVKAL